MNIIFNHLCSLKEIRMNSVVNSGRPISVNTILIVKIDAKGRIGNEYNSIPVNNKSK